MAWQGKHAVVVRCEKPPCERTQALHRTIYFATTLARSEIDRFTFESGFLT
jgi:hypothetical protein